MTPPQLLISVRSREEAQIAVASGCDLLDLKEPHDGSLGMVPLDVANQIAKETGSVPLSMALGECRDWLDDPALPQLPQQLKFVKLGLAGMSHSNDWRHDWERVRQQWVTQTRCAAEWIAVVYADHRAAAAPSPAAIVSAAIETGCRGVLFDTFRKQGRTLLDELPLAQLELLVESIRTAGLLVALAGSLRPHDVPDVLSLAPDIIAVRGAVCESRDRTGSLSASAIREFRQSLRVSQRVLPLQPKQKQES